MNDLAPIVLFVYNRPWHTQKTLNALSRNSLADQSVLYIYADGPKENADQEILNKIKQVQACIKEKQWCKEVIIVERETNLGLADSIIAGVTEIVNKHGEIIVLEDDILASRGFLKYMNDALHYYRDKNEVGCIHAWNYPLKGMNYAESTFFLKGADCWGWATWKRSWSLFNPNGAFLLSLLKTKKLENEFDRRGAFKFAEMLQNQICGKNDSWAIRWHASLFLSEKYCLQPTRPIVKNIGLDNSGMHCELVNIEQHPVDFIKISKIKIKESEWFFKAYTVFVGSNKTNLFFYKWQKLKIFLKHFYRQ